MPRYVTQARARCHGGASPTPPHPSVVFSPYAYVLGAPLAPHYFISEAGPGETGNKK